MSIYYLVNKYVSGSEGNYDFGTLETLPSGKFAASSSTNQNQYIYRTNSGVHVSDLSSGKLATYAFGAFKGTAAFSNRANQAPYYIEQVSNLRKNAFRTEEKLNGSFDSGVWNLKQKISDDPDNVRAAYKGPYAKIRIQFAVSKSSNPDGSNAEYLFSELTEFPSVVLNEVERTYSLQTTNPVYYLNNEYLFLQIGIFIAYASEDPQTRAYIWQNNRANAGYNYNWGAGFSAPDFRLNQYISKKEFVGSSSIRDSLGKDTSVTSQASRIEYDSLIRKVNSNATRILPQSSVPVSSKTFGVGSFEFGLNDTDWRINQELL